MAQGRLCAGQIGVAELLGLLFQFLGRLGVHVADAQPDDVLRQLFQKIDPAQLGLDLLGERGDVDLRRLLGVDLFLFDARRRLLAFGRQFLRHVGARELLALRQREQEAQRMFAGELPAGTGAAVDGLLGHGEIGGAQIGRLAAPLALPEPKCLVRRMVQRDKLVFQQQPASILRRLGVRRGGGDEVLVDRDHAWQSISGCEGEIATRCNSIRRMPNGDRTFTSKGPVPVLSRFSKGTLVPHDRFPEGFGRSQIAEEFVEGGSEPFRRDGPIDAVQKIEGRDAVRVLNGHESRPNLHMRLQQ